MRRPERSPRVQSLPTLRETSRIRSSSVTVRPFGVPRVVPGVVLTFVVAAGLAMGPVTGCATKVDPIPDARPVSLSAFSAPPDSLAAAGSSDEAEPGADEDDGEDFDLGAGDWSDFDFETDRNRFFRAVPGERVIVDSMVGQVNGRPIFADEFFEPIEDELVMIAAEATRPEEFGLKAGRIVMAELQSVVLNALFLAEAESDLSAEEQIGLRAWLAQLEEQLIAGHQGSEARTRRAIRETTDQAFEDHVEGLKDQALIRRLLQEKIAPRVIVSWRDIEREFERRSEEFNPMPSVTLARIRLRTGSQAVLIEDVKQRLAAGESFNEVARLANQPRDGTWQTFEVEDADLTRIELANEIVREQIAGLVAEGDTTEAFELGTTTWWIHVEQIVQPEHRSLYDPDVQRRLAQEIRRNRSTEEQDRYIASLLERGIYDELDAMAQRLLAIAMLRYGPPESQISGE